MPTSFKNTVISCIADLQNKAHGNSESLVKTCNFLLLETKGLFLGFFLQVGLTHASA